MTKSEIIDAVAYAIAPEGGVLITKTNAQGIEVSRTAATLTEHERGTMSFCKFMESTLRMATDDLPDRPTSQLFERLRSTVRALRVAMEKAIRPETRSQEGFLKTMKKIHELAKELEIPYDAPEE